MHQPFIVATSDGNLVCAEHGDTSETDMHRKEQGMLLNMVLLKFDVY